MLGENEIERVEEKMYFLADGGKKRDGERK